MFEFDHYSKVPDQNWRWPNFTPQEMACRGTGKLILVPSFMDRLQALRDLVGPLTVTSGYRSPEHNKKVGGAAGVHDTGRAVDLQVSGKQAYLVLAEAAKLGFTGIGVKQAGPHGSRFIHLDDLADDQTPGPRPWVWSY